MTGKSGAMKVMVKRSPVTLVLMERGSRDAEERERDTHVTMLCGEYEKERGTKKKRIRGRDMMYLLPTSLCLLFLSVFPLDHS